MPEILYQQGLDADMPYGHPYVELRAWSSEYGQRDVILESGKTSRYGTVRFDKDCQLLAADLPIWQLIRLAIAKYDELIAAHKSANKPAEHEETAVEEIDLPF